MDTAAVLLDGFDRIHSIIHRVVDGLSEAELSSRPNGSGNSIGWLVWHLTRIQDDHLADAFDGQQVWTRAGWADRLGLPLSLDDTGYGHTEAEVGEVRATAELLTGYFDAVQAQTTEYVREITPAELDRIVDESWQPPVSLGVRLVSVISDDLQHAGQAAYVKGLL
jgi:hypothetical protein